MGLKNERNLKHNSYFGKLAIRDYAFVRQLIN